MGYADVVRIIVSTLNKSGISYLLVGGLAANSYGVPRPTFDVDVLVGLADLEKFLPLARKAGFIFPEARAKQVIRGGGVLRLELAEEAYTVDPAAEQDISDLLTRSKNLSIFGVQARIIAPEDLILRKLLMWRVHDRYDALSILIRLRNELDVDYLKEKAKASGVGGSLEKLLRLVKP